MHPPSYHVGARKKENEEKLIFYNIKYYDDHDDDDYDKEYTSTTIQYMHK